MKRVMILFAHPALEKSRVNRHLVAAVRDLPDITFRDLYEEYPEFEIDIPREQSLLEQHDIVILQHPFFWYSTPALIKEWQDLVLQHGWAYGSEGRRLVGKCALSAITTGGRESAYQEGGHNRFTIRQFLTPIEQTFRLCGMDYLPPFVVHGTLRMAVEEIRAHAADYRKLVEALRDERLNLAAVRDAPRSNQNLDSAVESPRESF